MKKSKWDIIGNDIDKENSQYYDSWFYYWYDGEDYHDYYYMRTMNMIIQILSIEIMSVKEEFVSHLKE